MGSSSKSDVNYLSTSDGASPVASNGAADVLISTTASGGIDKSPPPEPSPYTKGELVLATHSGYIYKAKGWKRSWDEWVEVDRLMKQTGENLQKKLLLDKTQGINQNIKAGHTSPCKLENCVGWEMYGDASCVRQKNDSAMTDQVKKKRKQSVMKGKETVRGEKLVNISIPPALKKQLVDDFEFINQLGKLVKLPRTPSVDDILRKYMDYRKKKDNEISASVEEMLNGLRVYFDKALPMMLLYNGERQQYQEATSENAYPSAIYGAEHLLRLFVKLPALLYELNIEGEVLTELQQKLHDFVKFLKKKQSDFFLSTYHTPEDTEASCKREID
ncbi:hypothetical protein Ancab_016451 [Ancistrocladus abbreviatus]